ncbi:MAG: DUF2294 domain-containing protein [Candidatus Methylomirabilia bacterium]
MCKRTKGQLEAQISKLMVAFEKEYMGRGPTDVKTYLLRDMVLVRLKGVLTPAEQQLVKAQGVELLKQVRSKLLETGREMLEKGLRELTGCRVVSMHSDLSTRTGERIILFTLSENLEERLA